MRKNPLRQFAAPFGLCLAFTLNPVQAASLDDADAENEQDSDVEVHYPAAGSVTDLEMIHVIADVIDRPFQSTISIKSNLSNPTDGADFLKQMPGITLIRQGGTASDPVFRGLGQSRLNTLIDGVPFGGACNHRMDPATSYIRPGTLKAVNLLQGPQSVRSGNSISGAVRFDREDIRFDTLGVRAYGSYLHGSFNRQDINADGSLGYEHGYFNYSLNRSRGDDYVDGNGNTVKYTRYKTGNDRYALGFTPDRDTKIELSLQRSDGEIGNATMHMDATVLDRDSYGVRINRQNITPWLKGLALQYSHTTVDHYMDDFTLRSLKDTWIIMGQDWRQNFAKGEWIFTPHDAIELITGFEWRTDTYGAHAAGGVTRFQPIPDMRTIPKDRVLDFENFAGYAELAYQMTGQLRWITGLRGDRLKTTTGEMRAGGQTSRVVLSGSNQKRSQDMYSAFLRGEYIFESVPVELAIGFGHAERAHDFWEVYSMDGFDLKPERNNEFGAKVSYYGDKLAAHASAFYSRIDDFILIFRGDQANNVNVERAGGEVSMEYFFTNAFSLSGNASYVYAQNLTRNVPLAQTPPLEGTLGLHYNDGTFIASFRQRLVSRQTRIDPLYGNTLAVDSTPTSGFMVSSLQLGYQPVRAVDLSFGIDNLFNKAYSEHLNRIASSPLGGPALGKLIEPGRAFWGRVSINLDFL